MKASQLNRGEYGHYYANYISQAGEDDLLSCLEANLERMCSFYESIPDEKMDFSYAEGKWTIKELILHIIDAERVFSYRALRFARGDKTDLKGFEQDDYVISSEAAKRSKTSLIDEYRSVRNSTITLYRSLDDKMLRHIGTANNSPMSAAALGFIIVGHENHHARIIKDRYL
ncbi:MAG: DinB family protein [Flavobacteriaceae bacterium]|nr:DinB family protein [Flavobacteriaceae bacterium]